MLTKQELSVLPKFESVIFSKQKILTNNTQDVFTLITWNILQIHHKTHLQ